jgi:hypothetical protein
MARRGRRAGTSNRSVMDTGRLAEALKKAGIDPRYWCSYGTVGVEKDDGTVDYEDELAVVISPEGVDVDVCLEPLGVVVTCQYTGIQGGDKVSVYSPINPGDRVLVNLPDGDTAGPPAIQAIMHSAHNPMPIDADSELPIFQNDRFLVHSTGQDLDVRVVEADATFIAANVKVGGRDANEPLVLGNKRNERWERLYDQLVAHKHGSAVGPTTPPLAPELAQWQTQERTTLADDVSDNNFTKKANDGK